ncbi:MAG: DUF4450 domain-containing protein [Candidatus Hydrogenedentes bacterium]|nr:DUF4450 domain-containing protein [Candidatus Hydrogenedentota bacterium]
MNALTLLLGAAILAAAPNSARKVEPLVGCYTPIDGGWQIRITSDTNAARPKPGSQIGVVEGDYRLHRRPLYPPADRTMVWTEEELKQIPRVSFRPLIVAYNEPRFLFDFHSAGGLLGHLFIGLTQGSNSKWFHQWSEIDVAYTDGRMEYTLRDPAFAGVTVCLTAIPAADSAGLIVKVTVDGANKGTTLTWGYGGASAFFTNYNMGAKEFVFAPEQCAKDRVEWTGQDFALHRAFDKSDVITQEVFSAWRKLPNWQAVVRAGSSWKGSAAFGTPTAFLASPAQVCASSAAVSDPGEQLNCVAAQSVVITGKKWDGYIAVGMGTKIAEEIAHPKRAFAAALKRNMSIADRVVTHTPDPYLDSAARMMAFATEGTWGDIATVHGGWSWRFAYLGWRTAYGPNCYGWTDRIAKYIRNHTTLGLVKEGPDAGGLGSLLEYDPGVFYNMNEVFLDHVRQYFDYTNDLELMREIYPVLDGVLAWENRRLQPGNEYLYESALNTWISDSHWYIQGQCAQASAYMLQATGLMADLSVRLGKDPAPYKERAEKLWMKDKGVFAEYLDTRGNKLLHTEPELPTIYHSAEFGAADPAQVHQMLEWADTHLRADATAGAGKIMWSSNWFPNRGRSYTHSTYEMAYGEEMNFALTNFLDGRSDEGYALIRGSLCGVFNGPTPGGLSCHSNSNGTQRANDEFADSSSMWARAVCEGMFGILPKRPDGYVELSPQLPRDWPEASISTPQFSYEIERETGKVEIEWTSPTACSVHLRLPLNAARLGVVTVDGKTAPAKLEAGYGCLNWVTLQTPTKKRGEISIAYQPGPDTPVAPSKPVPALPPPAKVWKAPAAGNHDASRWTLIDLAKTYNVQVTDALKRLTDTAKPPAEPASQVGFGYWKDHLLQYHGSRNEAISDDAWRKKIGADGIGWTTDGIPFKSPKTGPNLGAISLHSDFPSSLNIPVNATGKTLYLMISGMTFPSQSHVTNLRVTLVYADGSREPVDLVNPFTIGDCWSTWCGRFHDTAANGFENIGGRSGPAGSSQVPDLTQPVALDTEAHLVPFEIKPGAKLESVQIEAIANDVIFGVMGATVLK